MSDADTPFRSPRSDSFVHLDDERQALYRIGRYRQWVGWAFVSNVTTQLVAVLCLSLWNNIYFVWDIPGWVFSVYLNILALSVLLILPLAVFSLVAGFLLTWSLSNKWAAGLVLILLGTPLVSLATLLTLNEVGNQRLRNQGISMGIFGVGAHAVFAQLQSYDSDCSVSR